MSKIWMPGGAGGGAGSDECTLVKANVPTGLKAVTADSDDEAVEGTLDTETTLADSQALSGQTFLKFNPVTKLFERRVGGMTNRGAVIQELGAGGSYTIPEGFQWLRKSDSKKPGQPDTWRFGGRTYSCRKNGMGKR